MRLALGKAKPARAVLPALGGGGDDDEPSAKRSRDAPPSPPADTEVLSKLERTAAFVARHGSSFEESTRRSTLRDPHFAFLHNVESSEHAYYQHRLAVLRADAAALPAEPLPPLPSQPPPLPLPLPAATAVATVATAPPPSEPLGAEDELLPPPRDLLQEVALWTQRAAHEASLRPRQYEAAEAAEAEPQPAAERGQPPRPRWERSAGAPGGGPRESPLGPPRAGLGSAGVAEADPYLAFLARKSGEFRSGAMWRPKSPR
jgi:hypothetical protein